MGGVLITRNSINIFRMIPEKGLASPAKAECFYFYAGTTVIDGRRERGCAGINKSPSRKKSR